MGCTKLFPVLCTVCGPLSTPNRAEAMALISTNHVMFFLYHFSEAMSARIIEVTKELQLLCKRRKVPSH